MLSWFYESFPFTCYPSSPFCNVPDNAIFESHGKLYKLLYRDAVKVRIVRWNYWTSLWWGDKKNG